MAKTTKNPARRAKKANKATTSTKRTAKPTVSKQRSSATRRPVVKRSRESAVDRAARAERILHVLRELYSDAECALHHRNAYELLVATVLSAQCTDERVNTVTPELFRRFPDARSMATTTLPELEELIRSTGFFRNKAKSLLGMAQLVCDEFSGEIPNTMADLLRLPGVARKTANCVLGTWFGENVGVVVDTHVGRLALRLRLLTTARDDKDAVKIEQDLMKLFPQAAWTYLSHALIWHGRQVCTARKPKCDACTLATDCPTAGTWT